MVEYELEPLDDESYELEPAYDLEPIDEPEPWYKKAAGVGEAALSAASGMLSWIPGGAVKAAGLVSGQLKEGSELGEAVQHALTYEPRTETGKTLAGYVAKPFEWISEKAQEAGEWTYEKTESPLLGAAARTAVESIPFVVPVAAVKGLRGLKGKIKTLDMLDDILKSPEQGPYVPGEFPKSVGVASSAFSPELAAQIKAAREAPLALPPGQGFDLQGPPYRPDMLPAVRDVAGEGFIMREPVRDLPYTKRGELVDMLRPEQPSTLTGIVERGATLGAVERIKSDFKNINEVPGPLSGYPGNKATMLQAGAYNNVIPQDLPYSRVVEPFGGSGLLGNAITKGKTIPRTLNDLDPDVINFHTVAKENVKPLMDKLYEIDDSIQSVRAQYPQGGEEAHSIIADLWKKNDAVLSDPGANPVDRAAAFSIKNNGAASVMGKSQKIISGEGTKAGTYVWHIKKNSITGQIQEIRRHSQALQGVDITNLDAADLLGRAKPGELVLLDPPYVQRSAQTGKVLDYNAGKDLTSIEGGVKFINENMGEAARRGIDMVYTNNAEPAIIEALKANGFQTKIVSVRSQNIGGKGGTRQEVIGWNRGSRGPLAFDRGGYGPTGGIQGNAGRSVMDIPGGTRPGEMAPVNAVPGEVSGLEPQLASGKYLVRGVRDGSLRLGNEGGIWATDSITLAETFGEKLELIEKPTKILNSDPFELAKRVGADDFTDITPAEWDTIRNQIKKEGYDAVNMGQGHMDGANDFWILDENYPRQPLRGGGTPKPIIKPETLETMVKGGSTGELPKYAEGSSINLERLDTTQDIKQFQNILTKAAEEKIGKRQVSWEETTKAAEDLAWDDKEFLKQAKKKGGFSAAEIDAMRQINTNALHDLFNTIQEMPADYMKRTPESRLAVLDKLNNYVEVMKETSMKSSEAGRALNIHKKMIQDNPEFAESAYRKQVLQQMMDALGGRELTDAMINDLKGIDFKDPSAVRQIVQKYHKANLWDMIYEGYISGLVSALTTHGANIIGNTLAITNKIPETVAAELLSGRSPAGALRAEAVGAWQGMKEGVRAAIKTYRSGFPSDMLTKIEYQRYAAIPGKAGEIIRIPLRGLVAADEFFKAIVYRAEANYQAYKIARNEGLGETAMAERMTKIINDATDPHFLDTHIKARNESIYRTFNTPLGKIGQGVMKLRTAIPGGRYVAPFVRIAINLGKYTLERTPFNFAKIALDYKSGKLSPSELNAELAKPIVGSLIAAVTVMNVLEGNITGAPPKNKKDRDLLYSTGWQPYSLKIGNKYISYARLEPIGSLVGITADFVNATREDGEINEKAGQIAMSFSRNLASKTFLTSVSGMLDAISDPERYGGSYVEKVAGSVVPSIVAAGARAIDPYVRDVETPLEAIQARIPGLSGGLPVKVGAFEMPIERPGGAWSRFLSPIQISESRPDMEIIAGAEINEREMERKLTKLQKKTMRELLRQSRIR